MSTTWTAAATANDTSVSIDTPKSKGNMFIVGDSWTTTLAGQILTQVTARFNNEDSSTGTVQCYYQDSSSSPVAIGSDTIAGSLTNQTLTFDFPSGQTLSSSNDFIIYFTSTGNQTLVQTTTLAAGLSPRTYYRNTGTAWNFTQYVPAHYSPMTITYSGTTPTTSETLLPPPVAWI